MRTKSVAHIRPLDVRVALAAVAIAAAAAAPTVAFAEATHPAKTTVSADPNDPPVPDPSGGSVGSSPQYVDNFDYSSITGDGGGGGGGGG